MVGDCSFESALHSFSANLADVGDLHREINEQSYAHKPTHAHIHTQLSRHNGITCICEQRWPAVPASLRSVGPVFLARHLQSLALADPAAESHLQCPARYVSQSGSCSRGCDTDEAHSAQVPKVPSSTTPPKLQLGGR